MGFNITKIYSGGKPAKRNNLYFFLGKCFKSNIILLNYYHNYVNQYSKYMTVKNYVLVHQRTITKIVLQRESIY